MASLVVNQGLQRIAVNASQASGTGVTYNSARFVQTMALDDATGALAAANTKLDDGTGYSQEYDAALDSTPARTNQTVLHIMTVPTTQGNFRVRRFSLHDDTAANVSGTSTTLVAGVDGQDITKDSLVTAVYRANLIYTAV